MIEFEVKNRWSGKTQFTAEINCAEDASLRVKMGLAVLWAFKTDADLRGANLRGANLSRADLRGANLSRADLRGADLRRANLRDANLRDANLRDANLLGADLRGTDLRVANLSGTEIPVIEALDTKIMAAIEAGGTLDMSQWHHPVCKTTHCRAGWATTLAGKAGAKLEDRYGCAAAGALLYARAYPDLPVPNFYASEADAMADIRARAALDVPGDRRAS